MLYWSMGWIQISGKGINEPSMGRVATVFIMYVLGVCMMVASDAQKYYTLKYKKGLINEGMFYATRNPNYLGEMLLYGTHHIVS
jgi:steroid 5-alpha reductase family enzyme